MKHTVEVRRDSLYLDGEKFFLLSGDFHYFRTLPEGWKRRMELMKDFGMTAVTTYVAWNLHEPKEGKFCFEGRADLARFVRTAQEVGLKIILRLSPYMCAEWEMGGLPSWLLKDRNLCVRSSDEAFMKPLRRYFEAMTAQIRPYLYTNGGPIILVGLENEYGSFGNDREYLKKLAQLYADCGLDVPYISANGSDPFKYINGTLPEHWNGVDCGAAIGGIDELKRLLEYQPDKPPMAGEAWDGYIQFWGKSFSNNREIDRNVEYMKAALEMGAVVNLYMFCGGTNFGFTSGALKPYGAYIPLQTSYDYDAPISEDGVPREKYFAMRDVVDAYLGKAPRAHIAPVHEVQSIPSVVLTEHASFLDQTDALAEKTVKCGKTVCMEDLDQDFGFIRYSCFINYTDPRPRYLLIDGLADRATVYFDGKYVGTVMRDAEDNEPIKFTVPEGGADLTILVENCGRINYGRDLYDRKGILNFVHVRIENPDGSFLYNYANNMGYTIQTLPLSTLEPLQYGSARIADGLPSFHKGSFRAKAGVDTFIDLRGWSKGLVWINGFCLGRYWSVMGPQQTLYVPGELLKETNTVEVLELHQPNEACAVSFIDHAILDEIPNADETLADFELK